MQIRPVEAALKHVDRRTGMMMMMITGAFRGYVNSPKNITRHGTIFISPTDLEPGICVPLD